MKEIKFRAWNLKANSMCEVTSLRVDENTGAFEKRDSVLMQYTGLKDKNGVEVYEGDIVEGGFRKHRGVVVFGEYANPFGGDQWTGYQCFYIRWSGEHADRIRGDTNYWFTNLEDTAAIVIGNIYENPELLKEKE